MTNSTDVINKSEQRNAKLFIRIKNYTKNVYMYLKCINIYNSNDNLEY